MYPVGQTESQSVSQTERPVSGRTAAPRSSPAAGRVAACCWASAPVLHRNRGRPGGGGSFSHSGTGLPALPFQRFLCLQPNPNSYVCTGGDGCWDSDAGTHRWHWHPKPQLPLAKDYMNNSDDHTQIWCWDNKQVFLPTQIIGRACKARAVGPSPHLQNTKTSPKASKVMLCRPAQQQNPHTSAGNG
jgi:hypothetical protein